MSGVPRHEARCAEPEDMVRIAWVNATKKWGGVKTWFLTFAREMRELGHENFVWARPGVFLDRCREELGHGKAVSFGPDFNPVSIGRFMAAFARARIDVLVINVGKDLTTAGVAARLLGIPVVQRIGLPGDIALKERTRRVHQWIRPHFLCPCRFIADGFLRNLPYVRPEDVHVVLNGKIPARSCTRPGTPRELVMTAQLIKTKRHEVVLEAMQGVENCRLNIVGTGDRDEELAALSRELGVDDRVVFSGFSKDVESVLARSDVFVLSSTSEGLPNTLLEAMACGVLPVSRDVGGVREVWPDELDEFLLPGNAGPAEFRDALRTVVALPDETLQAHKEQARTACAERFHLKKQARRFEAWLENLPR